MLLFNFIINEKKQVIFYFFLLKHVFMDRNVKVKCQKNELV